MYGQSTNIGTFGLMVLGLVATTLMFLTFAMTGMNLLDDAAANVTVERADAARTEEQRLRDLQERIAQLQTTRPDIPGPHLVSERDVADLREQVRAETERSARLKRDLADNAKVPVGHIYGAVRDIKSVQYVECLDGAAIMQPQGTRFATADPESLAKALTPGHVALLVRPGGFATFLAVRAALSRKPELKLGYLPVERGWQLDYSGTGG